MRKGNKCTLEPSSHFVVFFLLFSPFALAFFLVLVFSFCTGVRGSNVKNEWQS